MTGLTYGELDRVLKTLGFSAHAAPRGGKAYTHGSGALVTVPTFPEDDPVLPRHLDAARFVLDLYGIPLPTELAPPTQRSA
jgi:hypothetical protein